MLICSVQWVTSAHYLLSDLYVTDEVEDFETSSDQSTEDSDDQTEQVLTSLLLLT